MQNILITEASEDYELMDSGDGRKLERYGKMVLSRPDPQAMWSKSLSEEDWKKADAVFTRTSTSGKWEKKEGFPESWNINLSDVTFSLQLLPSKHLGIFPEQSSQWKWLGDKIKDRVSKGKPVSVLNLFGYTGGATLISAKAGASVCHVDASEFPVNKLKENMEISQLADKPIRLIVDDARKFIEREIKRGNKYDVIVMDPPVYGKGANGEVWNIEEDLTPLLLKAKNILSAEPLAFVLNGYASGYSHLTYKEMLSDIFPKSDGVLESGEVVIKQSNGRFLPSGIFARWSNH